MNRRQSQPNGVLRAVSRRGSLAETSALEVTLKDLTCPKCKQIYKTPKQLPCDHRLCLDCIQNLQRSSTGDNVVFHCPVANCNQPFATQADRFRTDKHLEEAARQWNLKNRTCENCAKSDVIDVKCPHCNHWLCHDHFVEHGASMRRDYREQDRNLRAIDCTIQTCIDHVQLQRRNAEYLRKENENTHRQMMGIVDRCFHEMNNQLEGVINQIDSVEEQLQKYHHSVREFRSEGNNIAINDEDDFDPQALIRMQQAINFMRQLANSKPTVDLPDDVRFKHTQIDTQAIEERLNDLKVLKSSLEVRTAQDKKVNIILPKDSKPCRAVLWSQTQDFCLNANEEIERCSNRNEKQKLPKEVLVVSNGIKLLVYGLDGQRLGQINVSRMPMLIVNWFDISPDGKVLALLTKAEKKVLLCDMDGSLRKIIGPNDLPDVNALSSLTLHDKWLMIVDSGNTANRQRQPGAVFLLKGPQFDPKEAERIPMEDVRRKIFPAAVTRARGSFFVLGSKAPSTSGNEAMELILYASDCQYVDDISRDLVSARQLCSDSCGRIFISVNHERQAEIIVLDPLGRKIGSVADPDMISCYGISHSEQRDCPNRLVVCDQENKCVHIFAMV